MPKLTSAPARRARALYGTRLSILLLLALLVLLPGCGSEPEHAAARFVDHGDGTFSDQGTGLMWAVNDNGETVTWDRARRYVEDFEGGGHTDWRLPSARELATLYDPRHPGRIPTCTRTETRVRVPDVLTLSCAQCWTATHDDFNAELFNFFHGKRLRMNREDPYGDGALALPVRSSD